MERILDFSQPVVVSDIEEVVKAMYHSNVPTLIMDAETVLNQFREHPDAYTRVDALLSQSTLPEAIYFGLSVLDTCILGRWNVLPEEQRAGIKQFLVGFIMERCTHPQEMRHPSNRFVLNKVNATLVSVAKREWPHRWPEFVDEVVGSAEFSPALAENAISILEMLVEDIFEFGDKSMTSRWVERKKQALAQYFEKVWDLCGRTLVTDDTVLLNKVLTCVAKYVPYVGLELCLNEGFLIGITQFVENAATRCAALKVLTEVAQLTPPPSASGIIETLFVEVMSRVVAWLPQGREDLATKTLMLHSGSDEDEQFVDAFCMFITKFLPKNLMSLQHQSRDAIVAAHELLVGLLRIDNKEMFKTAVDYCWWLGDFILNPRHGQHGTASQISHVLSAVIRDIRLTLIQKMAKPEEVIIVEDENGELQSIYLNDVDTIALYVTMRETLVFLTHINPRETDDTIRMLMAKQVDGSDWGWGKLNCLCWAFGALSGAFDADVEKQSFVTFLRDLLLMCENTAHTKDRAVLASNIMYVAGQYPRFLRNHGRFLLTLVKKNVSFMKEEFPGVRDMAVDTLVRVMRHCADILWVEAAGAPAHDMLSSVDVYVAELNHTQAHTLFEALGYIVKSAPKGNEEQAILTLLQAPNSAWTNIANLAAQEGPDSVVTPDMLRAMIHVLRCFNRTAKTCGNAFIHQMKVIFSDLQSLYVLYSSAITRYVEERGPGALNLQIVKLLRAAKKEILRTVEEFIAHTDETQFVAEEVVPHLFNTFLTDYQSATPDARDANVLAVVTAGVNVLKGFMAQGTAHILAAVFSPTVELITRNAEDFPEHRVNLFALLRSLNKECFQAFVQCVQETPDIVQGLMWAAKHIDRMTCNAGLDTLTEIVKRIGLESDAAADHFFREYTQQLITDTLVAMLDTLHRPAFQRQIVLLSLIFQLSASWGDTVDAPYAQSQLGAYLASQLAELPTLTTDQIQAFVDQCFATCKSRLEFERVFADILIEVQVWGAEQETLDIKEEERQMREQGIAGFARPEERVDYIRMYDDEASFAADGPE